MSKPVVSICMITYNHESFISEAIEGVLKQKCNFPFELVIGEDYSTDKTASIIKKYEKENPGIIKARYNHPNLGMMLNSERTLEECSGKYIAHCEGDDYWTDPLKLQKQVDYMESHLDSSFCFHQVNWINEAGEIIKKANNKEEISYNSPEKIFNARASLPSVVMKNNIITYPKEMMSAPHGDPFLFAMLATKGNSADLGFVGANRRIHSQGVYCGQTTTQKHLNTIITRRKMLSSDCFPPSIKKLIKTQMNSKKKKYLWDFIKSLNLRGFLLLLFA
jgi:glycosyltransferase involved in cell wall biosynthesis